jgi:hypothetical protein
MDKIQVNESQVLRVPAREWATPLTGVERQHGDARLKQVTYPKGYYRMEGMGGYELYEVVGPGRMRVTCLQRRQFIDKTPTGQHATYSLREGAKWKTWMIDDPLHWVGMRERVMALPPGRLLVAGLGLGLFAHHLMERPDITEVVVVEIDPDVVNLIVPTLPDRPNLKVVTADFYTYLQEHGRFEWDPGAGEWKEREVEWQPDAVLWDLAVGGPNETRSDFYRGLAAVATAFPGVALSQFGLLDNKQTIVG